MVHFLLHCSHMRCLDQIDDAELVGLAENPQSIPRYAWCDQCVTWQPVAELVTAPSAARNAGHPDEPADELLADFSGAAGSARPALPGPRLEQTSGTATAEPRPGVDDAGSPASSTSHTTGHRRASRTEQYVR